MRYFWIVLAVFCALVLAVLMVCKNIPGLCYNLVHKKKRRICWDPMADCNHPVDLDESEIFYHSDPIKFSKS